MKKNLFILFFIILISSCKKEDNVVTENRDVYLKNCGIIIIDGEQITICFDSVNDSRCPLDANCFLQGAAIANFTVYQNSGAYPITLSTLPRYSQYSPDTTIAGFKIHLENILPYPDFSNPAPQSAIHAILTISK